MTKQRVIASVVSPSFVMLLSSKFVKFPYILRQSIVGQGWTIDRLKLTYSEKCMHKLLTLSVCIVLLLSIPPSAAAVPVVSDRDLSNFQAQSGRSIATTTAAIRRVNAPAFDPTVDWNAAGMLWFGAVDWDAATKTAPIPGRNYADVRVAYTPQALQVFVSVIDYYLWLNPDPQPADDLSQYD